MDGSLPDLSAIQTPQQRRIIWSGAIELHDKAKNVQAQDLGLGTKIICSLPCHMALIQPDSDLNASKWPTKLLMQLLPSTILVTLQAFFRKSRNVSFDFSNGNVEAVKNLRGIMNNGFVGCVYFPKVVGCDIKVLMLMYSNRKRQFVGLIPLDQNGFLNAIRSLIAKLVKTKEQQLQAAVAAQQPRIRGTAQGSNPGVMPTTGPQGQPQTSASIDGSAPNLSAIQTLQQSQRRITWSGVIEWQDNTKIVQGLDTKITHFLSCRITPMEADSDLNVSKWPTKLLMQLLPSAVLAPLQTLFFKSRHVSFDFSNGDVEALKNLLGLLNKGYGGCVYFPNVVGCDIKILWLLFNSRKHQLMGLIPLDQNGFLNALRSLITKTKERVAHQIALEK